MVTTSRRTTLLPRGQSRRGLPSTDNVDGGTGVPARPSGPLRLMLARADGAAWCRHHDPRDPIFRRELLETGDIGLLHLAPSSQCFVRLLLQDLEALDCRLR